MKITSLIHELKARDIHLSVNEQKNLKVDAPNGLLTDELLKAIREHKPMLIKMFAPCRHCNSKLNVKVAPTWFQVWCPTLPIHFLIEEHETNLVKTLEVAQMVN